MSDESALHKACREGQLDLIRKLHSEGADFRHQNSLFLSSVDVAGLSETNADMDTYTLRANVLRTILDCDPTLTTTVYFHPDALLHVTREGHQEAPARVAFILRAIEAMKSDPRLRISTDVPLATAEAVLRAHSLDYFLLVRSLADYVGRLRTLVPFTPQIQRFRKMQPKSSSDADTSFGKGSLTAALRAAGAVITAIDGVVSNKTYNSMCCVRPPGHHAGVDGLIVDESSQAPSCGFCIFNSVAIGALHALSTYKDSIKRVAIVDIDVHHGNGTEEIIKRFSEERRQARERNALRKRGVNVPIVERDNDYADDQSIFFFSVHLWDQELKKNDKDTTTVNSGQIPLTGVSTTNVNEVITTDHGHSVSQSCTMNSTDPIQLIAQTNHQEVEDHSDFDSSALTHNVNTSGNANGRLSRRPVRAASRKLHTSGAFAEVESGMVEMSDENEGNGRQYNSAHLGITSNTALSPHSSLADSAYKKKNPRSLVTHSSQHNSHGFSSTANNDSFYENDATFFSAFSAQLPEDFSLQGWHDDMTTLFGGEYPFDASFQGVSKRSKSTRSPFANTSVNAQALELSFSGLPEGATWEPPGSTTNASDAPTIPAELTPLAVALAITKAINPPVVPSSVTSFVDPADHTNVRSFISKYSISRLTGLLRGVNIPPPTSGKTFSILNSQNRHSFVFPGSTPENGLRSSGHHLGGSSSRVPVAGCVPSPPLEDDAPKSLSYAEYLRLTSSNRSVPEKKVSSIETDKKEGGITSGLSVSRALITGLAQRIQLAYAPSVKSYVPTAPVLVEAGRLASQEFAEIAEFSGYPSLTLSPPLVPLPPSSAMPVSSSVDSFMLPTSYSMNMAMNMDLSMDSTKPLNLEEKMASTLLPTEASFPGTSLHDDRSIGIPDGVCFADYKEADSKVDLLKDSSVNMDDRSFPSVSAGLKRSRSTGDNSGDLLPHPVPSSSNCVSSTPSEPVEKEDPNLKRRCPLGTEIEEKETFSPLPPPVPLTLLGMGSSSSVNREGTPLSVPVVPAVALSGIYPTSREGSMSTDIHLRTPKPLGNSILSTPLTKSDPAPQNTAQTETYTHSSSHSFGSHLDGPNSHILNASSLSSLNSILNGTMVAHPGPAAAVGTPNASGVTGGLTLQIPTGLSRTVSFADRSGSFSAGGSNAYLNPSAFVHEGGISLTPRFSQQTPDPDRDSISGRPTGSPRVSDTGSIASPLMLGHGTPISSGAALARSLVARSQSFGSRWTQSPSVMPVSSASSQVSVVPELKKTLSDIRLAPAARSDPVTEATLSEIERDGTYSGSSSHPGSTTASPPLPGRSTVLEVLSSAGRHAQQRKTPPVASSPQTVVSRDRTDDIFAGDETVTRVSRSSLDTDSDSADNTNSAAPKNDASIAKSAFDRVAPVSASSTSASETRSPRYQLLHPTASPTDTDLESVHSHSNSHSHSHESNTYATSMTIVGDSGVVNDVVEATNAISDLHSEAQSGPLRPDLTALNLVANLRHNGSLENHPLGSSLTYSTSEVLRSLPLSVAQLQDTHRFLSSPPIPYSQNTPTPSASPDITSGFAAAADASVAGATANASANGGGRNGQSEGSSIAYQFYPGSGRRDSVAHNVVNAPIPPLWRDAPSRRDKKSTKGHSNTHIDTNTTSNNPTGPSGRIGARKAIANRLLPALRAFQPDLILLSAGFDAAHGDVGNLHNLNGKEGINLIPQDFAWITHQVLSVARVCCPGKVVSVLEGGYGKVRYVRPAEAESYAQRTAAEIEGIFREYKGVEADEGEFRILSMADTAPGFGVHSNTNPDPNFNSNSNSNPKPNPNSNANTGMANSLVPIPSDRSDSDSNAHHEADGEPEISSDPDSARSNTKLTPEIEAFTGVKSELTLGPASDADSESPALQQQENEHSQSRSASTIPSDSTSPVNFNQPKGTPSPAVPKPRNDILIRILDREVLANNCAAHVRALVDDGAAVAIGDPNTFPED